MSSEVKCKFDRNNVAVVAIAAMLFCSTAPLAAQGPPHYFAGDERVALDSALKDEDVQAALLYVNEHKSEMTETLLSLARSEAGEGALRARAELVARQMRDIGLKDVTLEKGATPNVIGRIKGRSRGAIVFVSTMSEPPHVAQQGEGAGSHGPRADGDRIFGPGTLGAAPTAALLAAAAALREEGVRPARDLIFATVPPGPAGVEGIKRLYASRGDKIVAVIEVQGDGASIACAPEGASVGASESSLVAASVAIVKWLGMEPKMKDATSASTRVAFAGGTPAIVLGGDRDEPHQISEGSADLQSMVRSAKHIVLLAATLR